MNNGRYAVLCDEPLGNGFAKAQYANNVSGYQAADFDNRDEALFFVETTADRYPGRLRIYDLQTGELVESKKR